MFKSLSTKIVLVVFTTTAFCVGAVMIILLFFLRGSAIESSIYNIEQITKLKAHFLNQHFSSIHHFGDMYAQNPVVQQIVESKDVDYAVLAGEVKNLEAEYDIEILFLDKKGYLVTPWKTKEQFVKRSSKSEMEHINSSDAHGATLLRKVDDQIYYSHFIKITDQRDRVIGFVEIVSSIEVLCRNNTCFGYTVSFQDSSDRNKKVVFSDSSIFSFISTSEWVHECPSINVFENVTSEILNQEVYGSQICLNNGLTVVFETPKSEILSNYKTQFGLVLWGAVTSIMIISIVLSHYLWRVLIYPLIKIDEFVREIKPGMLTERLSYLPNDEVGRVSESINAFLEQANQYEKDKSRNVLELTKFKQAVEHAFDAIVVTDAQARIIYINSAAEKTTGYSKEEVIGQTPTLWGGQMPRSFYNKMWSTIGKKKKSFHGIVKNIHKNGFHFTAELHIEPVLSKQNEVELYVAVQRDITELLEVEEAKTEFVSLASHQLRTPISIIKWYVEALLSEKTTNMNKSQFGYLQTILSANERMNDMVKQLLNISRIEVGKFIVETQDIKLKSFLASTVKAHDLDIKQRKHKVTKIIEPKDLVYKGDPQILHIILDNFLGNAIKYTPDKGDISVIIKRTTRRRKKGILIEVTDNGMGIPYVEQGHIFEKLYRADNVKKQDTNGNGLGLYMVSMLVKKVGGEIWFKSEENKGTTFSVFLPPMKTKKGTKFLEQ